MAKQYKFMIRSDIEGVSGIVSYEQAEPGKNEYEAGRRLFMNDLLALVVGLREGGAGEIHIYDEHCAGRNILLDELPEDVYIYVGKPPYTNDWAGGIDESFDGLIMLGYHSMRGTPNALLNHTYEPDLRGLILNGLHVGEIGMEIAIAECFGVPLALITGDSEGVREAKELVHDTAAVVVKQSLSEFGAICYPTSVTSAWIRAAAKKLASEGPAAKPRQSGASELEIKFFETPFAKVYLEQFGCDIIKGRNAASCWAEYRRRKALVDSLL